MMIKPVDNFIFMPEVGYGKVLQGGISRQDNQFLRGIKRLTHVGMKPDLH